MTISYFSVSNQAPGAITFGVGDSHEESLAVTALAWNADGSLAASEAHPVGNWFANEGAFTGYAGPFTSLPTGLDCVAHLHKAANEKVLASFSFVAP